MYIDKEPTCDHPNLKLILKPINFNIETRLNGFYNLLSHSKIDPTMMKMTSLKKLFENIYKETIYLTKMQTT